MGEQRAANVIIIGGQSNNSELNIATRNEKVFLIFQLVATIQHNDVKRSFFKKKGT